MKFVTRKNYEDLAEEYYEKSGTLLSLEDIKKRFEDVAEGANSVEEIYSDWDLKRNASFYYFTSEIETHVNHQVIPTSTRSSMFINGKSCTVRGVMRKLGYDNLEKLQEDLREEEITNEDIKEKINGGLDYQSLAEENGLHPTTLRSRVEDLGWDLQDALETPVRNYNTNQKEEPQEHKGGEREKADKALSELSTIDETIEEIHSQVDELHQEAERWKSLAEKVVETVENAQRSRAEASRQAFFYGLITIFATAATITIAIAWLAV